MIQSSFLFIFLIVALLSLLALSVGLYILFTKEKELNRQMMNHIHHVQLVTKSFYGPWCYWDVGDLYITTSQSFKKLFRFDVLAHVKLSDFMSLMGESAHSPFQRAMQHIKEYGGSFSLELGIFENSKQIEVHGLAIESPYAVDDKRKKTIILNLIEFTQKNVAQEKIEMINSKLRHEITILRRMVDASPVALWYRHSSGRIHFCNKAFANILDTSVHKAIAENRELIDRFGETRTYDLSRKALTLNERLSIRSHIVVDGQRKYLEISETPIIEMGETIGCAVDITAVENLEKELDLITRAQKEILNHLSSPVAVYAPDTRMIFFNHSYVKMFKQEESWLLTQPTLGEIMDHLREIRKIPEYSDFRAHKEGRMKLFNNLLEPIHEIMHQPDGTICRLVIAPTPSGGLVYIFDNITDSLSLERRFNTLIAVQKETIDHLYEGIIVFGTDYKLRFSNPSMRKIWDVNPDVYAEDTHLNEVIKSISHHFKSMQASKAWQAKVLDMVARRHSQQHRLKLKRDKLVECTYVPLPDGSHLLSFIDISDTWRFEQSLKQRNQTLENEDRLKSNFLSHVSYELQAPLNSIIGFSEILVNQYFGDLNDKQMDYSKGIYECAEKLSNLINDVLDLASIQAGTFSLEYQEILVDQLLNSVLVFIQNRAHDHGLEICIENFVEGKIIYVDSRRIRHALFNILSNAIKFTPSGGKITIQARESDEINMLDISIMDTGQGIVESELKKFSSVFQNILEVESEEVSSQSEIVESSEVSLEIKSEKLPHEEEVDENSYDSPRVGLDLVKRIIDLHGGYISVKTEENKGTTIVCSIPITPEAA